MEEQLILVDENDQPVGSMDKLSVHKIGLLHRAFSVFVFNTKGELLLQQRADNKYHSGGLWANTCCSHPGLHETLQDAAQRRLKEEMGLNCLPEHSFSFIYKEKLPNGLVEHELDHVFVAVSDDKPAINKTEVKAWKYMEVESLMNDMKHNSECYVVWLRICFEKVMEYLLDKNKRNQYEAA